MIDILLFAGDFHDPGTMRVKELEPLMDKIRAGLKKLRDVKKNEIIELYQQYSESLIKDGSTNAIEGVAFLSSWLRRGNFSQLVEKNLKDVSYLDGFVGGKKRIKAQPRGIVCHWIAGNVPTLGLFSLFQSMLVGNANLLRIPPKSHDTMQRLLGVFSRTTTANHLSGKDLLGAVGILYYGKEDTRANEEFSMLADARVVWGGEEAVKAITNLPRRSHCEDVVFGPKYSFSVFDAGATRSGNLPRYMRFLASDVFLFDQAACTSPHVVFFEKGGKPLDELAKMLASEFEKLSKRFPKQHPDQYISTRIMNARARHALDLKSSVICPRENDWTILINDRISLEEPIESRTVFLKEVGSIMDVVPLVTRKVQTIGCAIEDKEGLLAFADLATFTGVARCVNVGQMHLYDSPWDGLLLMSRLVNWVTLYHGD